MSEINQTPNRVNPADLHPDELIAFSQFAHLFGPYPPKRESIERYANDGRFIAGVRLSPKKPMVFRAGEVAEFFKARYAGLAVVKGALPQGDNRYTFSAPLEVNQ